MAELKLLPKKEFEIILDNGKVIPGKFGTWAVKRYCDIKKIPFEELSKKEDNSDIPFFQRINDAVDLILAAVEYSFRLNKKPFEYEQADGYEWMDQLSTDGLVNLLDHAAGEKKNQPANQQNGMISKEVSTPQVEA